MIIPTIEQLQINYITYVQYSLNQQGLTDIAAESTDYNAKGFGIAGLLSRSYSDALKLFESILPQNAVSSGINNQLSVKGAPSTFPSAPAFITATVNDILPDANYNIAVGTLATGANGITYKVIAQSPNSDVIVINTVNDTLNLVSITNGVGTGAAIDALLTLQSPILPSNQPNVNVGVSTLTVTASVDGVNQEGLSNAVNRLIEVNQIPLDNTRTTDFSVLLVNPDNGVTGCQVLNSNNWTPTTTNFGVFVLSGEPVNNEFLNKGLITNTTTEVYSRTSTQAVIDNSKKAILDQSLIGIFPYVSTVNTQYLVTSSLTQPFFKVSVSLTDGYSLSTRVTLNSGIELTLLQLIQREVRRAICGQPLGATLAIDYSNSQYLSSSLSISSIEQQLDVTLGTSTSAGNLGTWLKSRSVLIWNGTSYVYQSSIPLTLGIPQTESGTLPWVYDVADVPSQIYSNISVALEIV